MGERRYYKPTAEIEDREAFVDVLTECSHKLFTKINISFFILLE